MRNSRTLLIAALLSCIAATLLVGSARANGPRSGTLAATIHVSTPRDVRAGFSSIWVANGPTRTVARIDPTTGAVSAVIHVPNPASVLAVGAGAIWLTSFPGNNLTRIDPTSNTVTGTISLAPGGKGPVGVTVFDGYVWVANHDGEPTGSVAKIDPSTMTIVDVIPIGKQPDAGPNWLASGAGSLWVSVPNIPAIVRIDPLNDAVIATIPDKGVCGEIAADDKAVWVAGGGGEGCLPTITRINPATDDVKTVVRASGETDALALGLGSVWYATATSDILERIATTTGKLAAPLGLPGPAFGAITGFGSVWLTDAEDGLLFRIRP